MPLNVTATQTIDAPPEDVARIQFDPERDPEWIGGVNRVEWVTAPPLRVGSEVRRLGAFMGRPIEWIMHVEAYEPARHVGMRAVKSPFPMQVDYLLEPIDSGRRTQASIRIRGEATGMYRLPGPLLGPMVGSSVSGDLKRLDQLVRQRQSGQALSGDH
jgi:hypothetical protein